MEDFLEPSPLPYELPNFAAIHVEGLVPAFRTAVADHEAELAAIVGNPQEPTWENTFEALERAGGMLRRVLAVVFNYAGVLSTPQMREVEATISPELAAHNAAMLADEQLWARVKAVPQQPEGSQEAALQDYWVRRFTRGGAQLSADQREELRVLDVELAQACTAFGAAVQESAEAAAVLIDDEALLAGLSHQQMERLAEDAAEAGHRGWLIRLQLPSMQSVMEDLEHPAARAAVFDASVNRGDARCEELVLRVVRLRARRAELLGFSHHAEFVAEAETAGSVEAVEELLGQITPAAVAQAWEEYQRVADVRSRSLGAQTQGGVVTQGSSSTEVHGDAVMPAADWPYWSAQLRAKEFQSNDASNDTDIRNYFPLERVLVDGVFFAAQRLYGVVMTRREDVVGYHEDVQVWEVCEASGEGIGLVLVDMYARSTKRAGAWMSSFVDQSHMLGQRPVVVVVLNVAKPAAGQQALLSMEEVATIFHECGHALHGLFSDVRYPSVAGTHVPRDFVEFPSQINENWALEPAILAHYARHVDTGEALPSDFADAVRAQQHWAQGYATTEYVAACWLDLAWHKLSAQQAQEISSVEEFEREALLHAGVDMEGLIVPRYRSVYFNHIFSGGYSAAYWSYLWAEVLDAHGFQAFIATGAAQGLAAENISGTQGSSTHSSNAVSNTALIDEEDVRFAGERFRRMILSRGATIDYEDAVWMFCGKARSVVPLLQRKGLSSRGSGHIHSNSD